MLSRTVVVENPAFLRVEDAQLVVALADLAPPAQAPGLREPAKGAAYPRVPLDDIGLLLLDGPGISLTREVLAECAARNIALVVTDAKHLPAAQLVPYSGQTLSAKVFREQLQASLPLKKQVWRQIVQAKLSEQAAALRTPALDAPRCLGRGQGEGAAQRIQALSQNVRSGDPDNREAQAATLYFETLFGPAFVRDREEPGLNAMLNYGYAVMRACVARALVGTGLHPGLGVHHDNQYNPLALADDAIEPLRPVVDLHVLRVLAEFGEVETLTPPVKRALLGFLEKDLVFGSRRMPLLVCLGHYAASLKRTICGEGRKVEFPTLRDAPR
ncbi:MAG: type II CRISPR-associated endonuclease Cas1 [Fimbriimonadaceae bacterium]|nr:type II CRISPR-associated endonuclease Cas1 [Fimbriimonadaceae bacterium]